MNVGIDLNRGRTLALESIVTARCSIGKLEPYNVGVKLGAGDRNVYHVVESIQRSRKGRACAVSRKGLAGFRRISVHALNAHLRKLLKAGLLVEAEVARGRDRDLVGFEVKAPPGHKEGTCRCVGMKKGREYQPGDDLPSKCPAPYFSAPGNPLVSELALYIYGVVGVGGTMRAKIETYAKELGCSKPTINRLLPGLGKLGFKVDSGKANYNCNRITVPRFASTSSQSILSLSLDTSALELGTKMIDDETETIDHRTKVIDEHETKMIHLEDTVILEDQDSKKIKTIEDISDRARADARLPAKKLSSSQQSKRRRPNELPEDFTPTPELRRFAMEHHVNPERSFGAFKDNARAKAKISFDWAAEFRGWVRRAQEMGINRYDAPPPLRSADDDAPTDPAVLAANRATLAKMAGSMKIGPQAPAAKAAEAKTAADPDLGLDDLDWSIDRNAATLTEVAIAAEVKFERPDAEAGKAAPPSVE